MLLYPTIYALEMIKQIKDAVFAQFNSEEKKWVFLSWFDANHALLLSEWVVITDKPLRESLEIVYTKHAEGLLKEISFFVVDVVTDVVHVKNSEDIFTMSPQEYGFLVIDTEDDLSGVLLPNTSGVADSKAALFSLKQKYGIHGKVDIYVFRTMRIVVTK